MELAAYLAEIEKDFDAAAGLYAGISGPPWHLSRLPAGQRIHWTRANLHQATALLMSPDPKHMDRGRGIINRLIDNQDTDPASDSFGSWGQYFEEPASTTPRPKMVWPDFHAVIMGEWILKHPDKLGQPLVCRMKEAFRRTAYCVFRGNIGAHYTNFALMSTNVSLMAGEIFNDDFFREYGRRRLKRLIDILDNEGGYAEWNSPTYTIVSLMEAERLARWPSDPAIKADAMRLWRAGWEEIAHYWHGGLKLWTGPHSRAYANYMTPVVNAIFNARTGLNVPLHPSVDAPHSEPDGEVMPCPVDIVEQMKLASEGEATRKRLLYRSYVPDEGDFYSTSWMAADAALGSVNLEDLWFQRRSVIGYWNSAQGPAVALRVRFLHDGHDFSSAYIRSDQDGPRVLSSFGLLSNMGDKLAHIDIPDDGLFRASDFRVRYELSGDGCTVRDLGGGRYELAAGGRKAVVHTLPGRFGPYAVRWQTGREGDSVFVDGICYQGPVEAFNLVRVGEVAIAAGLEVLKTADAPTTATPTLEAGKPSQGFYQAHWPVGRGLKVSGPLGAIVYPGYKGGERSRTS
jgi:hypothetical protein